MRTIYIIVGSVERPKFLRGYSAPEAATLASVLAQVRDDLAPEALLGMTLSDQADALTGLGNTHLTL
jgi:hypothetical protein